jgi:hypothetical protein
LGHSYGQAGEYEAVVTASNPLGLVTATTTVMIVEAGGPNEGLQGYWRLDEMDGVRVDSSGQGNDLSDRNTVGSGPGQSGLGADLERDNQEYLSIDDGAQQGLNIGGDLTMVGWLKPESIEGGHRVVAGKYELGVNNRSYRLEVRGDNSRLRFITSGDGGYEVENGLTGNTALETGSWYHVAAVFEAGQQEQRLYLDGQEDGRQTVDHNQLYQSSAPFLLGASRRDGTDRQYFDGQLDEWRVYDRVLSQAEIAGLMSPGGSEQPIAGLSGATAGRWGTGQAGAAQSWATAMVRQASMRRWSPPATPWAWSPPPPR